MKENKTETNRRNNREMRKKNRNVCDTQVDEEQQRKQQKNAPHI